MNPDKTTHPLADGVRTRVQLMAQQDRLREQLLPIKEAIEAHADHLLRPEENPVHRETLKQVVYACVQLDMAHAFEDAKPAKHGWFGHHLYRVQCMRGEYAKVTEMLQRPPLERQEPADWDWPSHHGSDLPLYAVANGDLDAVAAMLWESMEFLMQHDLGPNERPLLSFWALVRRILQANAELAVLAHIMGREELVLPALQRARFCIEGGSECSTRPLLEDPGWIVRGKSLSVYLVHAIAAAGQGATALTLTEGQDLSSWGDETDWSFGYVMPIERSFATCLAQGGYVEEGLQRSGYKAYPYWNRLTFLNGFSAVAFERGHEALGHRLAGEYLDIVAHEVPADVNFRTYYARLCSFAEGMQRVGQLAWAQRAARWMVETGFKIDILPERPRAHHAQLIELLPAHEKTAAIDQLKQRARVAERDGSTRLLWPIQQTLHLLGEFEFTQGISNALMLRDQLRALGKCGKPTAARSLMNASLPHLKLTSINSNGGKALLEICVQNQEVTKAIELVMALPEERIIGALLKLFEACGRHPDTAIPELATHARELANLDHRLAAFAGLLGGASKRICFGEYGYKRYKYPNVNVLCEAGLHPSLIEGASPGC